MGKEAKIGLVIVGVLAGALVGLLVKRFVLNGPPVVDADPARLAAEPEPLGTAEKPTVVTAQKDSAAGVGGGIDGRAWSTSSPREAGADMPHGSYLPADAADPNARYAEQHNATSPEEVDPATLPQSNPFAQPLNEEPSTGTPAVAAPTATPNELQVAPQEVEALDARRQPTRATRNPLRRLSAEVPLEEAPNGSGSASRADFEAGQGETDPLEGRSDEAMPVDTDSFEKEFDEAQPQAADGATGSLDFEPAERDAAAERSAPTAQDWPAASREPAYGSNAPVPSRYGEPEETPQPQARDAGQMPAREQDFGAVGTPAAVASQAVTPQGERPADGRYTVQPNDSLWKISEKVYGDGRYFKALGEHNRAKLPQADRVMAGTVLDVPTTDDLVAQYPELCPRQRRSAVVKSRSLVTPTGAFETPTAPAADGDTYTVVEGDTLFDIARYVLGKASRWGEIYELNREVLGEDFDFLQPGLELRMPPKGRSAEVISERPTDRYVR